MTAFSTGTVADTTSCWLSLWQVTIMTAFSTGTVADTTSCWLSLWQVTIRLLLALVRQQAKRHQI